MNLPPFFYSQCPLSGVLRVTGEDAFEYLQGQFSNQLKQAGVHPVVYGFWLSIKGKVDADSYILKQAENDYLLISFGCDEVMLLDKIGRNIIADDVALEGVTNQYQAWITWGASSEIYSNVCLPDSGQSSSLEGGWVFQSKLLRSKNWVWLLPAHLKSELPFNQSENPIPLETIRMDEAVPFVPQDIGPSDFPQEGGLDSVGVSVSKGCYLGQEIMMRIHSMGNIKRALYSVQLSGPVPPLPAGLFLEEHSVGTLRSVATVHGVNQGLALLKKSSVHSGVGLSLMPEGIVCVKVLKPVDPIQ